MIEESQIVSEQEDVYASGKHNKVTDFFIGFGIYIGISLVLGLLTSLIGLVAYSFSNSDVIVNIFPFFGGMFSIISWIVSLVVALIIAKKVFTDRRLVRVGVWIGFLMPILAMAILLGACFIVLSGSGW